MDFYCVPLGIAVTLSNKHGIIRDPNNPNSTKILLSMVPMYLISAECPLGTIISALYDAEQQRADSDKSILHLDYTYEYCEKYGFPIVLQHKSSGDNLTVVNPPEVDGTFVSLAELRTQICKTENSDMLSKSIYAQYDDDLMGSIISLVPRAYLGGLTGTEATYGKDILTLGTKEGVAFCQYIHDTPAETVEELNKRLEAAFCQNIILDVFMEGFVQYTVEGEELTDAVTM